MPTIKSVKRPWIADKPKTSRWGKPVQEGGVDVKFYSTQAWRNARKRQLKEHPYCADCQKGKRFTSAGVVDHHVPIRFGGNKLDPRNLVSLCRSHHNRKTSRESRIQSPKQWQDFLRDNPDFLKQD